MHNNHRKSPSAEALLPEPLMSDLDFKPSERLKAALTGRPKVHGITIDPRGTHIIDDGLWIERHNVTGWKITVSVIDLPSIIADSRLETLAAQRLKEAFVHGQGVRRIWPEEFLDQYASMREGKTRPAITFKIILDKNLDVVSSKINRTAFLNTGEYHSGSFEQNSGLALEQGVNVEDWRKLAWNLYRKRCNDLATRFDQALYAKALTSNTDLTNPTGDMDDGELLIHEVMRLTNRIATQYLKDKNLTVPFKAQKAAINPSLVTPEYDFDAVCNSLCARLADHLTREGLPYVHLNSPMRRYQDYLALKVLGQERSGMPENPALRQEILELKGAFSRVAGSHDYLLSSRWKEEWRRALANQKPHPFKVIDASNPRVQKVLELKVMAQANNWRPLIAERELQVQGTVLYFTGINLHREASRDVQGWCISPNRGVSLNLASQRLLEVVQP